MTKKTAVYTSLIVLTVALLLVNAYTVNLLCPDKRQKQGIDNAPSGYYNKNVLLALQIFFLYFLKKPLTRLEVFLIMYICVSM